MDSFDYDYIIIGSGFGGSVSALRLSEKGYKVLIIEKGKWFEGKDFPKTNWNLKKWMWEPKLGLQGIFKMTFLNHVTVVSGVGVGGGSLTYANTLPIPKKEFFETGSWSKLRDWNSVLAPFYNRAYQMLGAEVNPKLHDADMIIKEIADDLGKSDHFGPTKVAVHFGTPGKTVKDPYFGGKGPDRTGCIHCGACMTGCRYNAKNTLDKNYLHLAQQQGAVIQAESEVHDVQPLISEDGSDGYRISWKASIGKKQNGSFTAKGVIFSGGVLGTVPLFLKLKESSLPRLSECVGHNVRTNNESLLSVTSTNNDDKDYSKGIAIGSILHTDEHSHLEPVRYGRGSGFARVLTVPTVHSKYAIMRLLGTIGILLKYPLRLFKTVITRTYAKRTVLLLFMQTLDSTLRMKRGRFTSIKTEREEGPKPNAFIPEALALSKRLGEKLKGVPSGNFSDLLLGTPTTAHILGGSVMGESAKQGVIDGSCNVFGYKNMMICDGSMISANPGVNPSLSITAISEFAMSQISIKEAI
ncbi:UNVERIFIED_CONTAM: hypothetical protein GTU68_066787 [Idotea baltica]|nr:hypothetical protein [Idotea baltica]